MAQKQTKKSNEKIKNNLNYMNKLLFSKEKSDKQAVCACLAKLKGDSVIHRPKTMNHKNDSLKKKMILKLLF